MDAKNAFWISFGWMTAEDGLGLSGSELSVYALVYSISQRGLGAYFASLETTGKILGMTSKTAHHALKSLVKKGLLKKQDIMKDGVKLCEYTASPLGMEEISEGAWKNLPYPMEKISIPPMEKISNKNKSSNEDKFKTKSKAPAPLILPFSSDRFRETWEALCEEKEWKKKTRNALQLALNKLGRYHEDFAIELIEKTIAGGWKGVVFDDTDTKYQEWKSARQQRIDNQTPRTAVVNKPRQLPADNNVDAMYARLRAKKEAEERELREQLQQKYGDTYRPSGGQDDR